MKLVSMGNPRTILKSAKAAAVAYSSGVWWKEFTEHVSEFKAAAKQQ